MTLELYNIKLELLWRTKGYKSKEVTDLNNKAKQLFGMSIYVDTNIAIRNKLLINYGRKNTNI